MKMSGILLIALLFIGSVAIAIANDEATCGTYAGYKAKPDGPFKCILYDTNWDRDTALAVKFRHCLQTPTLNLFVRNFQGADEVNHDLVPAERTLRMKAFTGKTAKFKASFRVVKANKAKGIRKHILVKLTYQPNSKALKIENLLQARFYMDLTDDCNWLDRLEMFEKIFFGIGMIFLICIILVLSVYIAKRRKNSKMVKYPPPPLMTHL